MAVPRNRTSNARKNSRRSHHAKKPMQIPSCTNCKAPHAPHRVCGSCGYYAGKSVIHAEAK